LRARRGRAYPVIAICRRSRCLKRCLGHFVPIRSRQLTTLTRMAGNSK
jgi:hypothetical protein